jgi:hypothetical protein
MLFTLGKGGKPETSFGVILDVGSGSVGVAIVASTSTEKFPTIVWSYREYLASSKDEVDIKKRINMTILNVFLELGGTGLKILRDKYPHKSPSIIQVSLNAPFAYTISRSINTKADKPFKVSSKVITALENKAKEEARDQVATALATKTMNLATLSEVITSIKVDGYPVRLPYNGEGKNVSLRQLMSLTSTDFVDEIEAARDKVLPRAEIDFDSFMSLYSRAISGIVSFKKDIGLFSITARASELMIVSGGDPFVSNFLTKGHHTLAASISEVSGLDMTESLGIMRENDIDHTKLLNKEKVESIKNLITAYEDEMTAFIRSQGDALVIPKDIYLQVDKSYEKFFGDSLTRAFFKATGLKHTVHLFTSKFFNFNNDNDSRILCSAYIFHKKLYRDQLAEEQYLL